MYRKLITIGALCSVAVYADFSYDQSSKITGGAIQSMLKVASVFSKSLREPIRTTHMVKGDRMAMISADNIDIIDLGAETFTEIDLKKKTYAVSTFAEVRAAMERAAAKMRKDSKDNEAEMTFRADVKQTGATRNINGMDTKQAILTLSADVIDKKSGEKQGTFDIVMDMWLAPQVSGYDEVKNFYSRLAAKQIFNPMSGIAGAMMAQHSKGMNDMIKEMSKLEGVPVLQYMRMGGAGAGMPPQDGQPQQTQAQPQEQQPKSIGDSAASAIGGRLGRIGGFGGLGRKKKTEEQPQAQAPQQQQQAEAAPQQRQSAPGSFIEMESQLTSFTSNIDASKFEVPAGFKKVESKRYSD